MLVAAEVTLLHDPFVSKLRYAKGAGLGTDFASGAKRFVHYDQTVFHTFGNGIFRAGNHTRRFNAMQAGKGKGSVFDVGILTLPQVQDSTILNPIAQFPPCFAGYFTAVK